jgi:hypothetical protein
MLLASKIGRRLTVLTWMDNQPLPFVCTTNLMERLPACLRRFAFKLRFDPLTPAKAALAFWRFFGIEAPDSLILPNEFPTEQASCRLPVYIRRARKSDRCLSRQGTGVRSDCPSM